MEVLLLDSIIQNLQHRKIRVQNWGFGYSHGSGHLQGERELHSQEFRHHGPIAGLGDKGFRHGIVGTAMERLAKTFEMGSHI